MGMVPRAGRVNVELVYFEGCPNVAAQRERLRAALEHVGLPPTWTEWDTGEHRTPGQYLDYASPTVLVNGVDVSGVGKGSGGGCAVDGGPSLDLLVRTLASKR